MSNQIKHCFELYGPSKAMCINCFLWGLLDVTCWSTKRVYVELWLHKLKWSIEQIYRQYSAFIDGMKCGYFINLGALMCKWFSVLMMELLEQM